MRSDDILKSIKNADKKYIEQSDFDNAKEFFEKSSPTRLFGLPAAKRSRSA